MQIKKAAFYKAASYYLFRAFFKTGATRRATAPPIRAVISWVQENILITCFKIFALITCMPAKVFPFKTGNRRPPANSTPSRYSTPNFTPDAATKAAGYDNLKGHKSVGGLRASTYNAMPKEGVEALVEFLKKFEAENA